MADPFSILVNVAGVADVLVRIGAYLKAIASDAKIIDDYIQDLTKELETLKSVITSVQDTFKAQMDIFRSPTDTPESDSETNLWRRVGETMTSCLRGVHTCETVVKAICGSGSSNLPHALDRLAKAHRKMSKAETIRQCRDQLATYHRNLQVLLTAINLYVALPITYVKCLTAPQEGGSVLI
jgi:hypothetical protein